MVRFDRVSGPLGESPKNCKAGLVWAAILQHVTSMGSPRKAEDLCPKGPLLFACPQVARIAARAERCGFSRR